MHVMCWRSKCVLSCAEYGGLGLDYSFSVAVAEELGNIRCGGIPMAIGVQTDMTTPALARYKPANPGVTLSESVLTVALESCH